MEKIMFIRVIGLGVTAGIVPLLAGMLYTSTNKDNPNSIFKNWASGVIICLAIFQILAIPFIFTGRSLTELSYLYAATLIVICMISLWLGRKRFKSMLFETLGFLRHTPWIAILPLLVIAFQIYMYVAYMHADEDDAFYVATATTAVSTDTLFQFDPYSGAAYDMFPSRYVLSPFPILNAVLSRLFGVHTLILAHTVLPLILLPLSYVVCAMIGYELFGKNREKTAYFVLFAAVIQMFAYTTTHTQGTVLLLRIWQGKAVLASILLPFVFYLGIRMMEHELERMDWLLFLCLMIACCMVSSMGIMLGAIMAGLLGLLAAFYKKNIWLLVKIFLCCIPNLLLSCIYLVIR